jgi:hypothetical protein
MFICVGEFFISNEIFKLGLDNFNILESNDLFTHDEIGLEM